MELNRDQIVNERLLKGAVERATFFAWFSAFAFGLLSFTTLAFLQRFDSSITLWDNSWPRILFGILPWVGIGLFMRKSKISARKKLPIFFAVHGLLFIAAGLTHVWPSMIQGNASAILYISAANGAFFYSTWAIIAVPFSALLTTVPIFFTLVGGSLTYVMIQANDTVISNLVLNDALSITLMGIGSGYFLHHVYRKLESLSYDQETEARSFLGRTVADAIYSNKQTELVDRVKNGFVLFLDIRESSKLARELGESWNDFVDKWFDVATRIADRNLGVVTKTGGDSVIITFGVFSGPAELTDIEDIDSDIKEASEIRWNQLTENTMNCIDSLFEGFDRLRAEIFPERSLLLGAGLDRGPIGCGVRGNELRKELDIWGDRVNCAARLQDYSKFIARLTGANISVAVISPYASDYLASTDRFKRQDTSQNPIRDFGGIKWVLYRTYKSKVSHNEELDKETSKKAA